jgi:hypothetical protein
MHLKPTAGRHLSQLKTREIPLTYPKMGKNFAVLDVFLWEMHLSPTAGCQIPTLIIENKL